MRTLIDYGREISEAFGRIINNAEYDNLWMRQRTGSWGFTEDTPHNECVYFTLDDVITDFQEDTFDYSENKTDATRGIETYQRLTSTNRLDADGELRYIAKAGDKIEWELVNEFKANRWSGVLLLPERVDAGGKICCAQFTAKRIAKVWLTIEQATVVLINMQSGLTLAESVIKAVGQQELDNALNKKYDHWAGARRAKSDKGRIRKRHGARNR